MLIRKMINGLLRKMVRSDRIILQKIGKSLERDRELSMRELIRKALLYGKSMALAPIYLRKCDHVGQKPRTRHKPTIENSGRIEIGNFVNINSRNVRTDLITGPKGLIEIGDEVSINFGVSIVSEKMVKVGDRTRIGPYTMIFDTDRHITGDRYKWAGGEAVIIEDDVWLATRVFVLKGSLIGRGSVIASGSVVSGVIPPYVVAGGVPARVLKFLKVPESLNGVQWGVNENVEEYSADTFRRVEKIFRELFPHLDFGSFNIRSSPGSVAGWDSIRHVRLVRRVEQEFGISIERDDWTRLSNMHKICKVIEKYRRKSKKRAVKKVGSI